MLKSVSVEEQMFFVPTIVPGFVGAAVSFVATRLTAALEPHELFALTDIVPVLYVELKASVIALLLEYPLTPKGNVQV